MSPDCYITYIDEYRQPYLLRYTIVYQEFYLSIQIH